ncbi:MAG TPA: DNA internalization-related competence protein ComEC/Rec2 [Methylotenera sp.]|nr:DNA internalization-related competence protein ComEC/Rec2 [Methylotenera sp.]HPH05734.1 DNA internalization-related competence protein ComEC/Rec2 [Methylotenera sp.]HPN01105.1 DNA internalization-related competence protein ComEC/Rec2 [Methylotenera sp.]
MIFAALSFVLGAWLVQQMPQLPSVTWLVCALILAIIILISQAYSGFQRYFQTKRIFKSSLLGVAFLLLGIVWASTFALWRMSDALPHAWEQKTIAIEGVVASVPEQTERGVRFRFDVEKILTKNAVVPKHISLNQYAESPNSKENGAAEPDEETQFNAFHAGERWLLNVRLKRPHGTQNPHGFDFEAWALSENIRATGSIKTKAGIKKLDDFVWRPSYVVAHLRENVKRRIAKTLANKPYSGVIQALVIGDDNQISAKDWQVFLRTGTTHLMSISGLHITMLSSLAFALVSIFWRRSPKLALAIPTRKAATVVGVLVALIYALMAGFSVPTQRTFYMLLVFAAALWSGRKVAIAQVLAIALLVVVLVEPWAVSAPGFWLSFGAVGVLAYVFGARIGGSHWLIAVIKSQWAVTIGMLPLLLVLFNQASIISPVANAFAIPLISFVVTPLALIGSFLPFDAPLHWAYQVLELGMWALHQLNNLPIATWQQHAPPSWTLLPAMLGVVWLLLPRGFPLRWLGFLGFAPMLFILPARAQLGEMQVTVLDVGQGLSVVVQTAKHTFLYDTGPKFNAQSDAGSRIVVPYLRGAGMHKLDGFMVSHNDIDHSGGMASVLTLMSVGWLDSGLPETFELPKNAENAALETMQCYAGQSWAWDGVDFEVLHPNLESYDDATLKDNERSCVLKITSAFGSVLLTGDIEKNNELDLVENQPDMLKSDVLIVPHHGSKTSSTSAFIDAVSPSASIFTPGYLNRYKHPTPEVLARYQASNSVLYRTDKQGALILQFNDKNSIHIKPWRQTYQRYWHDQAA